VSGIFISFEGGEGGGKSTQSRLLAGYLQDTGISVLHTREPGGTTGAEQIRELLVKGDAARWDGVTEVLLHTAARRDHVEKLIKPALAQGQVVICDRFIDSTIAYQGYGHGLGEAYIAMLQQLAIGTLRPHVTFILDIAPEQGIQRAASRRDGNNRYEDMQLAFHRRLREGFLTIARKEPGRCVVLDATAPIEQIQAQIRERVAALVKINTQNVKSVLTSDREI
jgi:dTMP kinase